MGKIMDYIEWRGDLDFATDRLNLVDILIFSLLSYLPLKRIVPGIGIKKEISLKDTAKAFFSSFHFSKNRSINITSTASPSFNTQIAELLEAAAASPRFEVVRLSRFEENTDLVVGRQFAALTFTLPGAKYEKVIAIRGTDDSVMGWKEDFELAYMEEIPAQASARDYLNRTINLFSGPFTVCGHSKGGNLAVYSGTFFNPMLQGKLKKIVSFDGPGFDFSIVGREPFQKSEPKVLNIVPEESMVGLLLDPVGKRTVISSDSFLLLQHNAFYWEVVRTGFRDATLTKNALFLEHTLKSWLKEIPVAERKIFLEALFEILGASEGKSIKLDPKENIKDITQILARYSKLDDKTKNLLSNVFKSLTAESTKRLSKTIKENLPRIS